MLLIASPEGPHGALTFLYFVILSASPCGCRAWTHGRRTEADTEREKRR